jgi:hypothetical protein
MKPPRFTYRRLLIPPFPAKPMQADIDANQ